MYSQYTIFSQKNNSNVMTLFIICLIILVLHRGNVLQHRNLIIYIFHDCQVNYIPYSLCNSKHNSYERLHTEIHALLCKYIPIYIGIVLGMCIEDKKLNKTKQTCLKHSALKAPAHLAIAKGVNGLRKNRFHIRSVVSPIWPCQSHN